MGANGYAAEGVLAAVMVLVLRCTLASLELRSSVVELAAVGAVVENMSVFTPVADSGDEVEDRVAAVAALLVQALDALETVVRDPAAASGVVLAAARAMCGIAHARFRLDPDAW